MEAVLNTKNLMPVKASIKESAIPAQAKETENPFSKLLKQKQELTGEQKPLDSRKENVSQTSQTSQSSQTSQPKESTTGEVKKETEKVSEEEQPKPSVQPDSLQQEALQQAALQQAAVQMTEYLPEPEPELKVSENPVVSVEAAGEVLLAEETAKPEKEAVSQPVLDLAAEETKAAEAVPKAEAQVSQTEKKPEAAEGRPETKAEATEPEEPKGKKLERTKPEVKDEISGTKTAESKVSEVKTEEAEKKLPKMQVAQEQAGANTEAEKISEEPQVRQTAANGVLKLKEARTDEGKAETPPEEERESSGEVHTFSAVEAAWKEKLGANSESGQQESRNFGAKAEDKRNISDSPDILGLGSEQQGMIYSAGNHRLFDNQPSFLNSKAGEIPLKTTPETLPADLGKTLAAKLPGSDAGTLTVELEPASLGKLTIRLIYEGDRAAVSIMASNPKTMEILNQKISEIAAILEEKTGQETIIYTQSPQQQSEDGLEQRQQGGQSDREENQGREQKNSQPSDSFAQQLRLGLI